MVPQLAFTSLGLVRSISVSSEPAFQHTGGCVQLGSCVKTANVGLLVPLWFPERGGELVRCHLLGGFVLLIPYVLSVYSPWGKDFASQCGYCSVQHSRDQPQLGMLMSLQS